MRRIASELDAGTMTLYHYVRTKDELLTLVVDAVMGEVVMPTTETMPTDACQFFYDCKNCGERLKPRQGDCCVFCSYGSVPCPPRQAGSCCA